MSKSFGIFWTVIVIILSGCSATQPLPIAARSGDTITLALGSLEGLTTTNTTATFTPDSTGTPVPLTPKAIFNLYPDKRSSVYPNSTAVASGTAHEQWLTVMVIDLPANLPVGLGTIRVNTSALQQNGPNARVENLNIGLEILQGVGAPHPLQYQLSWGALQTGDLSLLQRVQYQAYIKPPLQSCDQTATYGAIEMRFRLPYVIEPYGVTDWFRLVADDLSSINNKKTPQVTWSAREDQLIVVFSSVDGDLKCQDTRFSLVPTDSSFNDLGAPQLLSVTYYDVNGAVVPGSSASSYQVIVQ